MAFDIVAKVHASGPALRRAEITYYQACLFRLNLAGVSVPMCSDAFEHLTRLMDTSLRKIIGIDFSGDPRMWAPGRTCSNVWIAEGVLDGLGIRVERLQRLQSLRLAGHPFTTLSKFLNGMTGAFVGIDAPFSLPAQFLPDGPTAAWRKLATVDPAGRPFPMGKQLVATFAPDLAPTGKKVLRTTEKDWRDRGINVRSATWNGPRGGAPFAAACMTLLARHKGPVWLLTSGGGGATLAEAFPAAQLKEWAMPFQGYNGSKTEARANRREILKGLISRELSIAPELADECLLSADALDVVICMFGGAAVSSGRTVPMSDNSTRHIEGMIAVHT